MQVPKRVIIKISCKGIGSNSRTGSCVMKDSEQDFMIKVPASGGCNNRKAESMPDSQKLARKKMGQGTDSCVTDDSEPDIKVKAPTSCVSSKRKAETVLDAQRMMRRKMDHGRDLYVTNNSDSDMKVKVPAAGVCNKRKPGSMLDSQRLKRRKMDRGVKLKCDHILKELLMHRYGWVFNAPVDPVALNIPDYFDIISDPMDLGTIKSKLENNKYSCAEEFASDVHLTFSNAMRYNPPGHYVNYMANFLDGMFRSRWKLLVHKWNNESSGVEQGIRQNESLRYGNDKKNACSEQPSLNATNEVNQSMTLEEKKRLWKELMSMIDGKIPEKLRSTFKNSKLTGWIEGKINFDINDIDDSTWLELSRLRQSIKAAKVVEEKTANTGRRLLPAEAVHKGSDDGKPSMRSSSSKCGSCGGMRCHCGNQNKSGFCSPNNKSFRDQRPETRVDAGKKDVSIHATTSNQDIAKKNLRSQATSSNLSVVKKSLPTHATISNQDVAKKVLPTHAASSNSNVARKDLPAPAISSNSNAARKDLPAHATSSNSNVGKKKDIPTHASSSNWNVGTKDTPDHATTSNSNVATDDLPTHATTSSPDSHGWTRLDDRSSLEKAQRAAMLRSRFAETILKAKGKSDPKRLQEEKERLERLQREEEARIKALLEEQQLQVRKKIEKARQDALSAMEMMERTTKTDCNLRSLKELEKLCGLPPSFNLYADSLRRRLQLIGLVLKEDDFVEDEDAYLSGEGEGEDREEGEI